MIQRKLAAACAVVLGMIGTQAVGSAAGAVVPAAPLAPIVEPRVPQPPSEAAARMLEKASVDMLAHPEESAGSWLDAGSGRVVLGVKGKASPAFAAALSGYTIKGAGVQRKARSFADLKKVMDDTMALREVGGATINEAGIDWASNRVTVGLQPITDPAREKLAKLFGDAVAVQDIEAAQPFDGLDRWRDRGPYTGGAAWGSAGAVANHGDRCSTGFPVKRADGSKRFMVTAGHCNRHPRDAYTGNTEMTHWTVKIGTNIGYENSVCESTGSSCDHGSTKYGDISIIRVAGNQPKIYSGPRRATAKADIASEQTGHPAVDDNMCISASTTGSVCGFVVENNFTSVRYDIRDANGNIVETLVMQPVVKTHNSTGACAHPGDSGGAVYKPTNGDARASGILSGGNEVAGNCDMYYTSIYYAQQLFAVQTVTTANP